MWPRGASAKSDCLGLQGLVSLFNLFKRSLAHSLVQPLWSRAASVGIQDRPGFGSQLGVSVQMIWGSEVGALGKEMEEWRGEGSCLLRKKGEEKEEEEGAHN